MSNAAFVTLAYGLTWVVLAGYALYLAGRIRRAAATLERLSREAQNDHPQPVEVKL